MNILSLLSFTVFILCVFLALYVLRLDRHSRLNRLFILIPVTVALWSLAYTFIYSAVDTRTIWPWYRFGSLGWTFLASVVLHFCLLLTGKTRLLSRWWIYIVLYLPSCIMFYRAFTGVLLAERFVTGGILGTTEIHATGTAWYLAFLLYTSLFSLSCLVLLWRWGADSKGSRQRHQAKTLIITIVISSVLITGANMLLAPFISGTPALGAILSVSFVAGIWLAIYRHQFLKMKPEIAVEEIMARIVDMIVLTDSEFKIIRANPKTSELLGYGEQDLAGRHARDIIQDRDVLDCKIESLAHEECMGSRLVSNAMCRDGGLIPVTVYITPVKEKDSSAAGYVFILHDMREGIRLIQEIAERHHAEDRYRQITNASFEGIVIHDKGVIIDANLRMAQMSGYDSESEIIGKNLVEFITDEFRQDIVDGMDGRETRSYEFSFVRKDGATVPVDALVRPFSFRGQKVRVAAVRDITERKKAEEELKKSSAILRATIESVTEGILVVDRKGDIITYNRNFLSIMDLPEEWAETSDHDVREKLLLEKIHDPEDFEIKTRGIHMKVNECCSDNFLMKDSRIIERFSSPFNLDSVTVGRLYTYIDITEREKAETELKESRERFQKLAELLPETVFEIDLEGNLLFLNRSAYDVFGYKPSDVTVRNAFIMFSPHEHDRLKKNMELIIQGENIRGTEYSALKKDGTEFPVVVYSALIHRNGIPAGFRGIILDFTEHKKIEEKLRQFATTDSLTGLYNRRYFMEIAEQEIFRARRFGHNLTFMMIDIDHFKKVNDTYGHEAGDRVLSGLSDQFVKLVRRTDIVGRIGGEEFVIILVGIRPGEAADFVERFRKRIEETSVAVNSKKINMTVSIGVTHLLNNDNDISGILKRVDRALYSAKNDGRNRVVEV